MEEGGTQTKTGGNGEIRCEEGITRTVPQEKGSRNGLASEMQGSLQEHQCVLKKDTCPYNLFELVSC